MTDAGLRSPPARRFLASPLHETFRRAAAHRRMVEQSPVASTPSLVELHVGEPGFRSPPEVAWATERALRSGKVGYCDAPGLEDLRARLRDKLLFDNLIPSIVEQVLVTPGSTQGIFAVLTALTSPGDVIVLPSPCWPVYLQQAALLGLRCRSYRVDAGGADLDQLRAAAADGARVMVVNSPSNPSGVVLDRAVLESIVEIAARHEIDVVSDEAYEDFAFTAPHVSLAAVAVERGHAERIWTTFTFSKAFALTSLRVGYIVAPSLRKAGTVTRVQEAMLVCPSAAAQHGALAALDVRQRVLDASRTHLEAARQAALPALSRAGLISETPAGGWYVLCHPNSSCEEGAALESEILVRSSVSVMRGDVFLPDDQIGTAHGNSIARSFRLALCGQRAALVDGVGRLCEAFG